MTNNAITTAEDAPVEQYERCGEILQLLDATQVLKASYYGEQAYPKVCSAMAAADAEKATLWRELSLMPSILVLRVARIYLNAP